ncbi:MAG: hypothetical protein Q9M92_04770 [Enterobacterales bacterium]|nr:hypothetical protein [Enterobacterales bacterium]
MKVFQLAIKLSLFSILIGFIHTTYAAEKLIKGPVLAIMGQYLRFKIEMCHLQKI